MAQRACEKKDWRTVEELLAFTFKGREDIQRQLAVEYYDRGEWDDAELLLSDLFRGRKEYTAEGLKAMHMLANIKYNKKDYEEAEDYAVRAVNGRRIILGTQHVFYYQSVNLLVKIYEALGDASSVAETSAMLPIGFRCIAPPVPRLTQRLRGIGAPLAHGPQRSGLEMRGRVPQRHPPT